MCFLKIYSDSHSFKDVESNTSLPVYSAYDKGEIRSKKNNNTYSEFQISIDVSDADWDEFPKQTEDAIEFIQKHKNTIQEIIESKQCTEAYLDFPLWSRLDDEILNQNDRLPPKLIQLAGSLGLGIDIAIYSKEIENLT